MFEIFVLRVKRREIKKIYFLSFSSRLYKGCEKKNVPFHIFPIFFIVKTGGIQLYTLLFYDTVLTGT